jgi:hypothetical protein
LEGSWRQAASVRGHRAPIIDLSDALFMHGEGRRILRGALPAILILVLATTFTKAAPAEPLRLTLRDAVGMALKQNPQVQIANLSVAVTQENQIVARSALLPQANIAVSESVQRENLEAFLGAKIAGFPAGPNGSVPLLDLADWHRCRQSKENTTGARAQELTGREQDVQLPAAWSRRPRKPAYDNQIAALCKCNQARADLAHATGQIRREA